VLLGFSGVIVALQPGATALRFGHIAAVGSALLFALSLVLLRRTKATESDTALVASLLLVLSVLSFAVTLTRGGFAAVTPTDIAIATAAGLTLFCGHVLLVRAVVAPFQYSQIVWGCLYGTLLFGAPIETHTLVGAAIIVGSGWLILR
jgi:S-adenosylmethionine uptake transporter